MSVRRAALLIACLTGMAAAPAPPSGAPGEVKSVPPEVALAILGHKVVDAEGKDIGRLIDVLVGDDGVPTAAVIDFGGFMGVGSRKIAVQWSALHFAPRDPPHAITLSLTPDQIKAAPEFKDVSKPAPVVVAPPAAAAVAAPAAPPSSPAQ